MSNFVGNTSRLQQTGAFGDVTFDWAQDTHVDTRVTSDQLVQAQIQEHGHVIQLSLDERTTVVSPDSGSVVVSRPNRLHVFAETFNYLVATLPYILACSDITLEFGPSIPASAIGAFFDFLCAGYIGHISFLTIRAHAPRALNDWPLGTDINLLYNLTGLLSFTVSIDLLSRELLDALSMHTKLEQLCISGGHLGLNLPPFQQVQGGFFNLKRLDLTDVPFNKTVELVRVIATPSLEICISMNALSFPNEIHHLCSGIAEYCRGVTKVSLEIFNVAPGDVLQFLEYAPLLGLNLEILRVFYPHALPCSDADIRKIFRDCPGLKTLILNPRPRVQPANSNDCPTLKTLYDQVKKSGLVHFGAYFGPDALVPRSLGTAEGNTTLRVLDLGQTGGNNWGNEQSVTRYLHGLFPGVRLEEGEGCSPWVNQVARPDNGTSFGAFSIAP